MNFVEANVAGKASSGSAAIMPRSGEIEQVSMPALRQYFRIAMRRRYFILGALSVCVLLGLVISLLMTPKYTAESTIEISRESDKITDFQGVEREASIADQEFYQTQYGLLRSRMLSERVAAQLRVIDDPKFYGMFRYAGKGPAFALTNGAYPASGRPERQRAAGEIFLKHLTIVPTRLSRLVDIEFTSPRADFSAQVANAWADGFIQTNLERKVQATSYGRNLLQRQLGEVKDKLDASQRQLVSYASAEKIINLPSQTAADGKLASEHSIVADDLASLNGALSQATADRIQAQARYEEAGAGGASSEALNNQAINLLRQKRAELAADYQKLMTQFQPEYPAAVAVQSQIAQLDRSLAREEARVSNSLLSGYRQANEREQSLRKKVDQLKDSYLDLRRRSIQYNIYQQEVDTNRALYDGLLERFKQIGVAGGVGVNNISIVDTADVPIKPSSPKLWLNMAISIVVGLLIGAGGAWALEQIDEAVADPTEIETRLGLPLLGSVPKVESMSPQEALLDRKSEVVDAYLAVQTSLNFTTGHGVPRTLAVTSTRPAEGKSTTALALATMLSRSGRKVILVDGDMRSPSVHRFGGVSHDRGLSNYLSGQDDISDLTFVMPELGLTAMAAGPIPPNAAELLTGDRLGQLMTRLLETYDQVVVDSPPVMGLADAPLIAGSVEAVVFTIESHAVRSSMIKIALGRLYATNAHIVGAVLTKFEPKRAHMGYGYGYGYGYGKNEDAGRTN